MVNPSYIAKNNYSARPNSTTSCGGAISPSYITCTNCASDTNHDTRFTHVIGFDFVTNPNYDVINTLSVHNSISTKNINNLSEPELEIGSSSFIPNIVYGNSSAIAAGTNCTSTPGNLTTIGTKTKKK